jgi:DNA polymerase-3 subunit beta
MKFTCTQENLNQGLSKVQAIAGQATSLPILKNIFLQAKNGSLKLKATDLEIGITAQIRGKVEKEGSVTVEAKIISSFVALLPQDRVTLAGVEKGLAVEGGSHKIKINSLSAEDFPVIPKVDKTKGFKLDSVEIKKALAQILPAVSLDSTRPEINGVYWSVESGILTLAGTDSYRLAQRKLGIREKLGNGKNKGDFQGFFIVPLRTVKELIRIIDDETKAVDVYVSENQVLFVCGSTEIVSRLVEGEYPDYQQIIPSSYNLKFSLNKEDFVKAVKISGLFAEVGTNSVSLELDPKARHLAISSATSMGEERSDLELDIQGEEALKIIFDYRYLLDGLNSIEDEVVVFSATGQASPTMLKPQSEQEQFLCVVMPIRQ